MAARPSYSCLNEQKIDPVRRGPPPRLLPLGRRRRLHHFHGRVIFASGGCGPKHFCEAILLWIIRFVMLLPLLGREYAPEGQEFGAHAAIFFRYMQGGSPMDPLSGL
jgi:hypothetical protein